MEEFQRWAQKFAKRRCGEGEFEESVVQTAVLKRWRQKLSVALQKGNAAVFRARMGCQVVQGDPEPLNQALVLGASFLDEHLGTAPSRGGGECGGYATFHTSATNFYVQTGFSANAAAWPRQSSPSARTPHHRHHHSPHRRHRGTARRRPRAPPPLATST